MNRDLASSAQTLAAIDPQAANAATINGANDAVGSLDVTSFRWAYVIVSYGTATAGAEVDVTVEDSATGQDTWSLVDIGGSTATFTQVTDANDLSVQIGMIDLDQVENFIRVKAVVANGSGIDALSAVVVLTANRDTQYAGVPTATTFSLV